MQRFFFPHLSLGKDIDISDTSFVHQVSRVLRASIGEDIVLFNGDGWEYVYKIHSITKKGIGLSFVKAYENVSDSKTCVRLYQALPNKYDKIEYILQKGVEVWIREFIFFRPERSQRLLVTAHKIERFQEIVREATEQCGGNLPPSVIFLEDRMIVPENRQSYVLHTEEQGSKHIRDIDIKNSPINIFVWPEGWWSREEISFFEEKNIQKIHLWNRVLRTETTGPIVAFFLIQK